jgi:hypothetical protein
LANRVVVFLYLAWQKAAASVLSLMLFQVEVFEESPALVKDWRVFISDKRGYSSLIFL